MCLCFPTVTNAQGKPSPAVGDYTQKKSDRRYGGTPVKCQFTPPAPNPSHPDFPAPPQDQPHSAEFFSKPHSSAAFCFCASLFLLYFVQFLSVSINRVFFLFLLSGGSFPTGIMTLSCPQCSPPPVIFSFP